MNNIEELRAEKDILESTIAEKRIEHQNEQDQPIDGNAQLDLEHAQLELKINGYKMMLNKAIADDDKDEKDRFTSLISSTTAQLTYYEVRNDLQSIKLSLHNLEAKMSKAMEEIFITPLSCSIDRLRQLFELCGFGLAPLKSRVVSVKNIPSDPTYNFKFDFDEQDEKASYQPLQDFLASKNIHVVNVTDGEDLLDGLLYREEIWTLKKDFTNPVAGKRRLRYIVQGTTDFVRLICNNGFVCRSTIQYFIEVKKGEIDEPELREAFVQLIGGNVANTWHSPPVFLTNLQNSHYVFFITFNPRDSSYNLQILEFSTFEQAIFYLESSTSTMCSCTANFLRKDTPFSTPPKKDRNDESQNDLDFEDEFVDSNVNLEFLGDDIDDDLDQNDDDET